MWLLMVAALQNLERGSMKEEDMRIDENTNFHRKMDLINFISKRRVPNGSDPIHNRRINLGLMPTEVSSRFAGGLDSSVVPVVSPVSEGLEIGAGVSSQFAEMK
nr:CLAVATA3/ESR (CLE)-related protein 25-like [Ipomoea batatas]